MRLRTKKTRPGHIYFSVSFVFNILPLPNYPHTLLAFLYNFKEAFEAHAVMKRPEKYRKKYRAQSKRNSFFFLTLLLDTDWTFDRGEVSPFLSVDSKRGWRKAERKAEEERSSQLDQRIAIRFVNDRDAIGSISLKTIRGKVREQQVRVELDSR